MLADNVYWVMREVLVNRAPTRQGRGTERSFTPSPVTANRVRQALEDQRPVSSIPQASLVPPSTGSPDKTTIQRPKTVKNVYGLPIKEKKVKKA